MGDTTVLPPVSENGRTPLDDFLSILGDMEVEYEEITEGEEALVELTGGEKVTVEYDGTYNLLQFIFAAEIKVADRRRRDLEKLLTAFNAGLALGAFMLVSEGSEELVLFRYSCVAASSFEEAQCAALLLAISEGVETGVEAVRLLVNSEMTVNQTLDIVLMDTEGSVQ